MSIDLERYILACIWQDQAQETINLDDLREEFFTGENRAIFSKIYQYRKEGRPADLLESTEVLGPEITATLVQSQGGGLTMYPYYVQKLKKQTYRRRIEEAISSGKDPSPADLRGLLEETGTTNERLFNLNGDLHDFIKTVDERVSGNYERYSLGFRDLDETLGYVRPGTLITAGARTGVGKTNFCLKLFNNQIQKDVRCLFLSSEMGYTELIERLVAINSKLSLWDIRNGRLGQEQVAELTTVLQGRLYGKFGYIFELSRFDIGKIKELINRLEVKFVFVDYLQRFNLRGRHNDTRAAVLSDIVNELKATALDKGVVVVAASQLSRSVEGTKTPSLSDLKESGGIEEASDIVMLLSQHGENENVKLLRLDIAKNRQGTTRSFDYCMDRRNCDIRKLEQSEVRESVQQ